LIHRSNRDS